MPDGATFKTIDSDFLTVAENQDFHPTDVLEDADGSILVLDTGGWYKLCCPTSQIGKPDVLGAIYRVKRINAETFDDPRGLKIDWAKLSIDDLSRKLDDPRPFVRRRAILNVAKSGAKGVEFLTFEIGRDLSAEAWRNAVWAACRIPGKASLDLGISLILADDPSVRETAWRLIGNSPRPLDEHALTELGGAFPMFEQHYRPSTARVAIEAASRVGLPGLSSRIGSSLRRYRGDRAVQEACIRAMIDQENPEQLGMALKYASQAEAASILIALDQMGQQVPIDRIQTLLESDDERLRSIGEWIVQGHSDYAEILVGWLANRLEVVPLKSEKITIIERQFAKLSIAPKIRERLGMYLRSKDLRTDLKMIALRSAAKSNLKTLPDDWREGLTLCLASDDPQIARQAIATAHALPSTGDGTGELIAALKKIADRADSPAELRLDALSSMPDGPGAVSDSTFAFLREGLDPEKPVSIRLNCADVLAKAKLTSDQLSSLADSLKTAGPLDRDRLLPSFNDSTDAAVGKKLIAALKASPSVNSLRIEELKPRFAKFGDAVHADAQSLYAAIEAGAADQRGKLDDLSRDLPAGEVRRGQLVFNGTKTACASCHAIGYIGGNTGPDLSRIGAIRNDRDLLEAIVFPSASFVRSYEPMIVATKAGQVHSGVLKKDSPDEVVLATGPDKEVRIARAEVEEMKPGTVSVMPSGLDSQMSKQDLADLIAFLKSRK